VAKVKDNAKIILDVLAQNKAMSLVDLMSVVDLPDAEVERIVESLERDNFVRVSQGGTLDEIVAIREQGLRAAG
jgi:DNA-binding IclR family transcriptional regulator